MPAMLARGAAALLVLWPLLVSAQKGVDYRAVGDSAAILYDAPSLRGKKLFVAPRGMPLEVVVSIEGWLKVRDRAGDLTWIERRAVVERRTVVTTAAAQVRDRPEDGAPVVVELAAEVVLELQDPAPAGGWLRVRHRDGAAGFIRASQVWGV